MILQMVLRCGIVGMRAASDPAHRLAPPPIAAGNDKRRPPPPLLPGARPADLVRADLFRCDQPGDMAQSGGIAVASQPGDDAIGAFGDEGVVAEGFAPMNLA